MKRVAVTGLGLVCALGDSVADCWPRVAAGETGIRPLRDPGKPRYKFTHGAETISFDPQKYFSEKELLLLERFTQLLLVAAREAVKQSGIKFEGALKEKTAVITGTGVGGQFSEEEGYRRLYIENNPRVAPLTIPRTMANAGASQICLEFGIYGPSYTVATACSSSNHALGQAFQMVRSGAVTAAITGGSEAVFAEGLLRAWEAMRVVAPDFCRPFSLGRKGLSLGEGAAALVLEDWEHAKARGVAILGEVVGFGMSSDAHHITQPSQSGAARAMKWALDDAGVHAEQIGYINAHGTGTLANDVTESAAIRTVFGAAAEGISISSTKSMHGHTLGAAGAIEAVITLLALRDGVLPPTANFTEADPACNIKVIANSPERKSVDFAVSNSFAFGGLNASVVLGRGDTLGKDPTTP